jgi:hypothetical protein
MTESTPTSDFQQRITAAVAAGDTVAARNAHRDWLQAEPDNVAALVGLARLLPIVAERERLVTRALAIDPHSADALAAHADIQQWKAQGVHIVTVPRFAPTQQLPEEVPPPAPAPVVMCPKHPANEATLRCHSCGAPLCVQCAIPNEVGHLCAECRDQRIPERYRSTRAQQITSALVGALLAIIIPLPLSLLLGIPFIGPFVFLLGGGLVGNVSAQLCERLLRKRGRGIATGASSGIIIGSVLVMGWLGFYGNVLLIMIGIMYVFVAIRSVRQSLL